MKHNVNFKVTIQANDNYIIKHATHKVTREHVYAVYDGDEFLFVAIPRTFVDFVEDVAGNNECASLQEVFEDKNGRKWAYWTDSEVDEDYLTPLPVAYMY